MHPLAMLSQWGVDGSRHSREASLTHHLLSHFRKAFSSTLAFLQVGAVPAPRNQLVRLVGGLHDVSPGTLDKPWQAETDLLLRHHRQKILAICRVIWSRRRAITERGNPRPAPIIILHWHLFSFGILLGEVLSIDLHQSTFLHHYHRLILKGRRRSWLGDLKGRQLTRCIQSCQFLPAPCISAEQVVHRQRQLRSLDAKKLKESLHEGVLHLGGPQHLLATVVKAHWVGSSESLRRLWPTPSWDFHPWTYSLHRISV